MRPDKNDVKFWQCFYKRLALLNLLDATPQMLDILLNHPEIPVYTTATGCESESILLHTSTGIAALANLKTA